MTEGQFFAYFETTCLTTTFIIALEVGWFFGERCVLRKANAMNITGFMASLIAVTYCFLKLIYFYTGAEELSCDQLKIILGVGQGSSNALAFLHLFLRADAVNKINTHWRPWRWFGIALTALNWATLLAVCFTRTAVLATSGSQRCKFTFDQSTFEAKWVVQLLNHVVFSMMFVFPLRQHMKEMHRAGVEHQRQHAGVESHRSHAPNSSVAMSTGSRTSAEPTATGSSRGADVFRRLVWRATLSMAISSAFTLVVAIMVFVQFADPNIDLPVVALSNLDNGLTLASIYFANSGGYVAKDPWDKAFDRVAGAIVSTSTASNGGAATNGHNMVMKAANAALRQHAARDPPPALRDSLRGVERDSGLHLPPSEQLPLHYG
ncbi:hypothetical protein JKP88DRAFT_302592 [Tribonema minus]|uniref:Uncharacterized protein n=1 Tax=Tribonema minus TaxID=303371 RepID=A0A835Z9N7_9STRA|nr:hypothetical protein JKP88DRAFT_302592 [Tribonema minus]